MNLTQQSPAADSASMNPTSTTLAGELPALNDRYADAILRDCEDLYDAFEVQGVRDLLAGTGATDTNYEVDNANPQSFSVYAHLVDGGADAVGDFSNYQLAADYARELSIKHDMPMFDYVPEALRGRKALQ